MVRAKGAFIQGRLESLAHIERDTYMAAAGHKAREFDKELEKFVKHGTAPGDCACRASKVTDPRARTAR
jgi:hypothetical protein